MKYRTVFIMKFIVIIVLLISPITAWGEEAAQVLLDWEEILMRDELPLEFTQTVSTLFPGKEIVTVDHVRRWSSTHWLVTRHSAHHGPLIFGSSSSGSWAMATDSKIMYDSTKQLSLHTVLNPVSFDLQKPSSRFMEAKGQWDGPFWVVERTFRNAGTSRTWIDPLSHRLVREEFQDKEGNILYTLSRTEFKSVSASDVEDRRSAARKGAQQVFSNQREWWHHVLLNRLQQEAVNILLPRWLPEGMLMVAAIKDEGGTLHLRYSNGTQVISIFQRQARGKIRSYFTQDVEFAVFVTKRRDKMVTIIGPLIRVEMEDIVDSLQYLNEILNQEESN